MENYRWQVDLELGNLSDLSLKFGWEDQIIKKKFWRMQMGKKGIPGQGNPGAKLQIMSSSEHSSAFFEQQVVHSDLLAR